MGLTRHLILCKFENTDYLCRQVFCRLEPRWIKHNFSNNFDVWKVHSDQSEHLFQVIWKLRATRRKRIHSDEQSAVYLERHFRCVKYNPCSFLPFTLLYSPNKHLNHRQNRYLDPVEFIETGPQTRSGDAFEKLDHSFKVQSRWTIENETRPGYFLCKFFGGLSLARACRPYRCTSVIIV